MWGLAAAFSIGSFFQATSLFYAINKRVNGEHFFKVVGPLFKSAFAAASSGLVMYLLLKVFDRSVWVKRLSFLGKIEATRDLPFEKFVLDTRYTVNLIVLMVMTALVVEIIYFGV